MGRSSIFTRMKKFFTRITPFLLLATGAFMSMLYLSFTQPSTTQQASWMIAAMFLPVIVVMIVVDVILRKAFPLKTYWIWIIEIVLLLVAVYAWIVKE
jgi:hypothetical protein